jgi:hypothetical protein
MDWILIETLSFDLQSVVDTKPAISFGIRHSPYAGNLTANIYQDNNRQVAVSNGTSNGTSNYNSNSNSNNSNSRSSTSTTSTKTANGYRETITTTSSTSSYSTKGGSTYESSHGI